MTNGDSNQQTGVETAWPLPSVEASLEPPTDGEWSVDSCYGGTNYDSVATVTLVVSGPGGVELACCGEDAPFSIPAGIMLGAFSATSVTACTGNSFGLFGGGNVTGNGFDVIVDASGSATEINVADVVGPMVSVGSVDSYVFSGLTDVRSAELLSGYDSGLQILDMAGPRSTGSTEHGDSEGVGSVINAPMVLFLVGLAITLLVGFVVAYGWYMNRSWRFFAMGSTALSSAMAQLALPSLSFSNAHWSFQFDAATPWPVTMAFIAMATALFWLDHVRRPGRMSHTSRSSDQRLMAIESFPGGLTPPNLN